VDANVKVPSSSDGGQAANGSGQVTDTKGLAAANKLVANLRKFYGNMKREEVKPLLWVVEGNGIQPSYEALHGLQKAVDESSQNLFQSAAGAIKNVRLVILWIVPQSVTDVQREYAAKLDAWAKQPNSILATTLVIENSCPLSTTMVRQQYPLLMRSIAALLGAGKINAKNSFATVAAQLHNAGYTFTALAAGAIGVDASPGAFSEGMIVGARGEINPINASKRLSILADDAFSRQALTTVSDAWPKRPAATEPTPNDSGYAAYQFWLKLQQEVFVNIIVPQKLQALDAFKDDVTVWLRGDYSVNQEQVTFVQLTDVKDSGIDVSGAVPGYEGDFYFHFTVFRGVGTAPGNTPRQLRQAQQPSAAQQTSANVAGAPTP
jgi:hypothetical protein